MHKKIIKKLRFLIIATILVAVVLTGRLASLQIINHEHWYNRAEFNKSRILPISAPRGEIFDVNGEQLVANRPGFTVSLMDLDRNHSDYIINYLSDLLEIEESVIRGKIFDNRYKRYIPVRLKTDVDFDIVSQITENRTDLPGVILEVQPIRSYVQGNTAAHIQGFIGDSRVSDRLLEQWEEMGYTFRVGDVVGQSGLESIWEPYLQGQDGGQRVEVNNVGQLINVESLTEPIPGNNLNLTLDIRLQKAMEDALITQMERLQAENPFMGRKAAAVVMDPNNGAIRAMVSLPDYNPNSFREDYRELASDPLQPMVNRTIAGLYPVGSTFKMVTGLAALEEGTLRINEHNNCTGTITRFGATKSCFNQTAHGRLDVKGALIKSCNVFFYEASLKLGQENLYKWSLNFGFGRPTGFNDVSGERMGRAAGAETKRALGYTDPWYPSETMDASIGQGFQEITPLQLANYISAIANGGDFYRPYLVDRITDNENNVVEIFEPELLRSIDVSEENWQAIRDGLEGVTRPGGTASIFRNLPVHVAGKTGSAQTGRRVENEQGEWVNEPPHSLFVAYAPAENPEIAVAIIVENGGLGSNSSVPAGYDFFEAYFMGQDDLDIE